MFFKKLSDIKLSRTTQKEVIETLAELGVVVLGGSGDVMGSGNPLSLTTCLRYTAESLAMRSRPGLEKLVKWIPKLTP